MPSMQVEPVLAHAEIDLQALRRSRTTTAGAVLAPGDGERYFHKVELDGQTLKKVEDALERDNFMTAEEAKDWGLIDEIVACGEASGDRCWPLPLH